MSELRPLFSLPDTRDRIVEAALAAFAEHGYHGASMRDIASRADVSQSLLHHHFGSKDALWNLVGERITADFLDYAASAVAPDHLTAETVPNALRTYMRYWKDHPAALRFNLWRLLEGPKGERKARSQAINKRAVPLFQQAQRAGFLRKDMPPGLALIIAGSLVQFWLHSQTEIRDALAITGDASMDDETYLKYVIGLVSAPPKRR